MSAWRGLIAPSEKTTTVATAFLAASRRAPVACPPSAPRSLPLPSPPRRFGSRPLPSPRLLSILSKLNAAPFTSVPQKKKREKLIPTTQAGEHENLTTEFSFEHNVGNPLEKTYNEPKTTIVNLPPGFIGNNLAVPTCTDQQLVSEYLEEGEPCPPDTQVGTISLRLAVVASGLRAHGAGVQHGNCLRQYLDFGLQYPWLLHTGPVDIGAPFG